MNEVEEWKDVEGYSRYKVSNLGEVLDTKYNRLVAKQLAGVPQYYYVNMTRDDGERKLPRLHRLVAIAFVEGRSDEFNVVDHIDRDKFNNVWTNLRWVDHKGNMRNKEVSLMVGDAFLLDYCNRFDNSSAAYTYIAVRMLTGKSVEQGIADYEEYLLYGLTRTKVEWEGNEVYLTDLCKDYNIPYETVRQRMFAGKPLWNALTGIPDSHFNSFELKGRNVTGHWIPHIKYLEAFLGKQLDTALSKYDVYEDIIEHDKFDYLRQTVLGATGTIRELCAHFGVSEGCVSTRMTRRGWSLEKALTTPQERIRRWNINGETKTTKDWCIHFSIAPGTFNSYRARADRTLKDALEHFGINCSDMVIIPGE